MNRLIAAGWLALLLCVPLRAAERLTFEAADFQTWRFPHGLVNVGADGVQVTRFASSYNAVANADSFTSGTVGTSGLRRARTPSNQRDAGLAVDLDPGTWWQPDLGDGPQRSWLEIDLGRAVVADRIRLVFPDTVGARPFGFFSVYSSPGAPVFGGRESRVVFNRVGRPVTDNRRRVVDLPLRSIDRSPVSAPHLVDEDTLRFEVVRFLRIELEDTVPGGALAEVEVREVGFNLATRVEFADRVAEGELVWGGGTWTSNARECPACGKAAGADALIDADLARRWWAIESRASVDWRDLGVWGVVDLGSVFRLGRLVWLPLVAGVSPLIYAGERDRQCLWEDIEFLTSDGRASAAADADVEGPFEYEMLSSVANEASPRRYLYDFQFPPRAARLVLWRHTKSGGTCRALQLFIYHASGYPAQVQLESGNLFLDRAYSIRRVEWDADVPPGARVQVQTATGNGFDTVTRYFLTNGQEVSRTAYDAAKSRNRGDIVEDQVRDATWSSWSEPQRFSGQAFLSPTPRSWLQVRVQLVSEDPQAMPVLRSVTFVMDPPWVAGGVDGAVSPREVALDSLVEFRYRLSPLGETRDDAGFDRVLIALPPGSDDASVTDVTIGGRPVAVAARVRQDSLVLQLPSPVRREPVDIRFRTRLLQSAFVFDAFVTLSQDTTIQQDVNPAAWGATQVFVPEALAATSLLHDVRHTRLLTPNDDGVNDELRVELTVLKATKAAQVSVHALDGQAVAQLRNARPDRRRAVYTWDGRTASGDPVRPGVYVLRIRLQTDAGAETALRLVHVAY